MFPCPEGKTNLNYQLPFPPVTQPTIDLECNQIKCFYFFFQEGFWQRSNCIQACSAKSMSFSVAFLPSHPMREVTRVMHPRFCTTTSAERPLSPFNKLIVSHAEKWANVSLLRSGLPSHNSCCVFPLFTQCIHQDFYYLKNADFSGDQSNNVM